MKEGIDTPRIERREFLKGLGALCGLAVAEVAGVSSLSAKEHVAPPNQAGAEFFVDAPAGVSIQFRSESEKRISHEDMKRLTAAVEKLHARFPQLIQELKIIPGNGRNGSATAAMDSDSGMRSLRIDTDFLTKDQSVLDDIVFHEAGHLVERVMYAGYARNSKEFRAMQQRMHKLQELLVEIQLHINTGRFAHVRAAFLQIMYLTNKTKNPGTFYSVISGHAELFASAFCIRELYTDEFSAFIAKGPQEDQRVAKQIMELIPSASVIRTRLQELSKKRR